MRPNHFYRFTKREIILRFFALYDRPSSYDGHLARFLNTYMHEHRNAPKSFVDEKRILFSDTVECIIKKVFNGEPPSKLPVTIEEALLVGVAKNLPLLNSESTKSLKTKYDKLCSHAEFSESSLREGLSKKPRVAARLAAAISVFSGK
jgi:hypothetical protein